MFDADGFEPTAATLIATRRAMLYDFLLTLNQHALARRLYAPTQETELRKAIVDLPIVFSTSDYLLLAEELGFPQRQWKQHLEQYWRLGMFDQTGQRHGRPVFSRPAIEHVQSEIDAVFDAHMSLSRRRQVLHDRRICQDVDSAQRLHEAHQHIMQQSAALAQGLVQRWITHGPTGLLQSSEYPCAALLLLLEHRIDELQSTGWQSNDILPILRADLVALYRTLKTPLLTDKGPTGQRKEATLWDQSLLHQPEHSERRLELFEKLEAVRPRYRQILAETRGCSSDEAEQLLTLLFTGGLGGLIDWRNGGRGATGSEQQLLQRDLQDIIGGLAVASQQQIQARLDHLAAAIEETKTAFSLAPLIRAYPSTAYRKKRQHKHIPADLAACFAQHAKIEAKTAVALIKRLMIYGPPGLLLPSEWPAAFHPRLWSYLGMQKLGHIEGTLNLSRMVTQANRYNLTLGQEAIAHPVLVGVCNHFRKPDYYNSGDSAHLGNVALRKSLKFAGRRRLHEHWLVLPLELDLQLVDAALRPQGESCWLTLVIEGATELPMSFWLSEQAPGENEIALALYLAIFRPKDYDWPLRGIPEHILLPRSRVPGMDLTKAAEFLLTDLPMGKDRDRMLKQTGDAKTLRKALQERMGRPRLEGKRRGPKQQLTIKQAEQQIRSWLFETYFATFRAASVPGWVRKRGVVMPGEDTPAAGWLLPVVAETETLRHGVELNKVPYIDPSCGIEPGLHVRVRATPPRLGRPRGVFVQHGDNDDPLYLSREQEK